MSPGNPKREVPKGPYTREKAHFYSVKKNEKGLLEFEIMAQVNVPIVVDEYTRIVYLFSNGTITNYYGPNGKPCAMINGQITECL